MPAPRRWCITPLLRQFHIFRRHLCHASSSLIFYYHWFSFSLLRYQWSAAAIFFILPTLFARCHATTLLFCRHTADAADAAMLPTCFRAPISAADTFLRRLIRRYAICWYGAISMMAACHAGHILMPGIICRHAAEPYDAYWCWCRCRHFATLALPLTCCAAQLSRCWCRADAAMARYAATPCRHYAMPAPAPLLIYFMPAASARCRCRHAWWCRAPLNIQLLRADSYFASCAPLRAMAPICASCWCCCWYAAYTARWCCFRLRRATLTLSPTLNTLPEPRRHTPVAPPPLYADTPYCRRYITHAGGCHITPRRPCHIGIRYAMSHDYARCCLAIARQR